MNFKRTKFLLFSTVLVGSLIYGSQTFAQEQESQAPTEPSAAATASTDTSAAVQEIAATRGEESTSAPAVQGETSAASSEGSSTAAESGTASTVSSTEESQATTESTTTEETQEEKTITPPTTVNNEMGSFTMPSGRSDIQRRMFAARAITRGISADQANLPTKSFIDVSSHNGDISVANFQKIKSYGITGVVVKLTEGNWYTNPNAENQIKNAQSAGLKVSAYHFANYTDSASAVAEANFFVATAKKLNLPSSTVMVNDLEINANESCTDSALAFNQKVSQSGYPTTRHYVGLGWITSGIVNPSKLGYKNIWVAAYPYTPKDNLYTNYNSWQWASDLNFPGISGNFDISADYTGDFGPAPAPVSQAPMYRVYNPNSGEHHYTMNSYEKEDLVKKGWRYEGIAWNAPLQGTPVYRMYNPNRGGDHHYTLNTNEVSMLKGKGWRYEGIAWYSGGPNKLLRLYNPNAKSGSHHYTMNTYEKDNLVKKGWRYEGVAWNAN